MHVNIQERMHTVTGLGRWMLQYYKYTYTLFPDSCDCSLFYCIFCHYFGLQLQYKSMHVQYNLYLIDIFGACSSNNLLVNQQFKLYSLFANQWTLLHVLGKLSCHTFKQSSDIQNPNGEGQKNGSNDFI